MKSIKLGLTEYRKGYIRYIPYLNRAKNVLELKVFDSLAVW